VADLLVVVDDIAKMITTAVVRFTHTHGIVSEVDIAIVAEEFRHDGDCDDVCDRKEALGN
jgi:hypothetical protein